MKVETDVCLLRTGVHSIEHRFSCYANEVIWTFSVLTNATRVCTQLNDLEMKGGRHLKVNVSVPNHRLFVGNIPKSKSKADIMEEFNKVTGKK